MPMEKGVGGALQPISIDEDKRMVSTKEVLRYFHSQVNSRCTSMLTPTLSWEAIFLKLKNITPASSRLFGLNLAFRFNNVSCQSRRLG